MIMIDHKSSRTGDVAIARFTAAGALDRRRKRVRCD